MKKIAFSVMCCMSVSAWAACEREDIDHYLEKGFTPAQVTQLCTPAVATPAQNTVVVEDVVNEPEIEAESVPPQPAVRTELPDQAVLLERLQQALKVEELRIEGHALVFKHRFKAKYGEEDVFGNLQEVKPSMQVSIDLPSMRLIKVAKRIPVIRSAYVLLSGDIAQTVVDQDSYKPKQLQGIQEYLDEEVGQNTIKIKLHSDADAQRVGADLQELGLIYRRR